MRIWPIDPSPINTCWYAQLHSLCISWSKSIVANLKK